MWRGECFVWQSKAGIKAAADFVLIPKSWQKNFLIYFEWYSQHTTGQSTKMERV